MLIMTKSQQVETYLREGIQNGRWALGERLPMEDELMTELNVSRSTLREALNGLAGAGLVVRQPSRGTFVARVPAVGNIAIVSEAKLLASPAQYIDFKIVKLAHSLIGGSGYRPMMSIGHGDGPEPFMSSLHLFDQAVMRETTGVLNTVVMADVEERLASEGIPCVNIEYLMPIRKHSVVIHHTKCFELAALVLRACGYNDFAVMSVDYSHEQVGENVHRISRAFYSKVKAMLKLPEDRWVSMPFSMDLGDAEATFRAWWERPNRPRAMLFEDDSVFHIVSRVILDMGIKVPDDLAIVTFANAGREFQFPVPITRVESDVTELVTTAWDMLQKLISGQPVEEPIVYIQPRLRHGESL